MRLRYLCEQAAGGGVRARKTVVPERAVGGDGDAVLLAPGQHGMFDGPFLQMIEHLIASDVAVAGKLAGLDQIRHVEIAHTKGKYLAFVAQGLRRPQRSPAGDAPLASAADNNPADRS